MSKIKNKKENLDYDKYNDETFNIDLDTIDEAWVNEDESANIEITHDLQNLNIKSNDSEINEYDNLMRRRDINYTGQTGYNSQMHQLNELYRHMQNQFQHQQFIPHFPQQPFFSQNIPLEQLQYFKQQHELLRQQMPQSPQQPIPQSPQQPISQPQQQPIPQSPQTFSSYQHFHLSPHMMQNMPSHGFNLQPTQSHANNIGISLPPFPSFQNQPSIDSLAQNTETVTSEHNNNENKELKGENYVEEDYESDSYQEDEEFIESEKDQANKYGTFERMTDKEISQIINAIKASRVTENPTVNNFYYLINKWKNTGTYKLHRPICYYFPLINRSPSISYFTGCLGRISTGTSRTPRITIVEKNNEETLHYFAFSKEGGIDVGDERKLLFYIEKIFILLIELEDLDRSIRYIDGHQNNEFKDKVKSRYNYKGMIASKNEKIDKILTMLHIKGSSYPEESVDRLISSILSVTKGAGMMERILRQIDDPTLKTTVFRASVSYLCDITVGSLKKENNKLANLVPLFKSFLEEQNATVIYMYMAAIAKNQKKMALQSHIFVRSKFGMRVLRCIIRRAIQIIEEKTLPEKLVRQFHLVCLQFFKFIYDIFIQTYNAARSSGALSNNKEEDKIFARFEDLTSLLKDVCEYLIKDPTTANDSYKEFLRKIENKTN